MNYANLHTHSIYSDGAHTPREIIDQAISSEMTAIGISDHSYTFFDTRYCLAKEKNSQYINELRSLKEEYRGKIDVLVGIELDGFSKGYERSDFDYIIGSCHYINFDGEYISVDSNIEGVRYGIEKYCGGDALEFARRYYNTYTELICSMRPDILGHIDLVAKLGAVDESSAEYRKMALSALCDALINEGFRVVSGGTDNHLMLIDLRPFDITGKDFEKRLDELCRNEKRSKK